MVMKKPYFLFEPLLEEPEVKLRAASVHPIIHCILVNALMNEVRTIATVDSPDPQGHFAQQHRFEFNVER